MDHKLSVTSNFYGTKNVCISCNNYAYFILFLIFSHIIVVRIVGDLRMHVILKLYMYTLIHFIIA